jgi:nifR3 family TIM-barrel protein
MSLRLGSLDIDPPLLLAPMAGVTDRYYRLLIRRIGGVGLVAAEFVSSESMTRGGKRPRVRRLLLFAEEERPISIQIYGSDPARMADAASMVQELGADVCDINMGCPANKILKGCSGAALMGDLPLAQRIVRAVRGRLTMPLTVKFRLGIESDRRNFLELGRICEGEGVAAVTLHGRTARQMYSGSADWSAIRELRETLSIPVIGNGDVRTADDVVRLMTESGCPAVMIGRASMKNPWIFRQAAERLSGGAMAPATLADRREIILEHFRMIAKGEEELAATGGRKMKSFALHKIRTFTGWYTHGLPGGRRLRQRINDLRSADEFLEAVERFFAEIEAEGIDLRTPAEAFALDDLPERAGSEREGLAQEGNRR